MNVAEAASIAAITQYPSKYDPLNEPENNRKRQIDVLYSMKDEDLKYLTEDEYQQAKAYEMVFTNSKNYKGSQIKSDDSKSKKNSITDYYTDYVITTVQEDLQKMGYTSKKAHDLVYGGGLKIYTAIDFDVQDSMEDVYENYRRMPDETVQGAMVVMGYDGRVMGMSAETARKKLLWSSTVPQIQTGRPDLQLSRYLFTALLLKRQKRITKQVFIGQQFSKTGLSKPLKVSLGL